MKNHLFLAFSMLLIYSCSEGIEVSQSSTVDAAVKSTSFDRDPFESNYKPLASERTLIKSVNLYDGLGNEFSNFDVLFDNGIIEEIGKDIVDGDATIIDAKGKWLTPGIIDIHSHMGVYPAPGVRTSSDGNEATSPITAEVWAEHSVWTQDPQFSLALKGGVTAFHVLPGSANLMGGRGATFKNIPRNTIHDMKFPGAPHSLKMACGENPKRVYGNRGSAPSTRMGNMAGYRKAWINASDYQRRKNEYTSKSDEAKELIDPPKRNLELDTLAGVLDGEILVQNHCYRADEMAMMIEMSKEFDYKITAFHHAVEAYKIADLLADEGICGALWADWWGFKHEAYDMVPANIAIVDQARGGKGCAIVHSDDEVGIQHLNQEAAKALSAGLRAGYEISKARAIKWITSNPAKAAGILDQTGTIEIGKDADLVIWSKNPFSVYALAEYVFIDGAEAFVRGEKQTQPVTDFDLGIINPSDERASL
ncbi:MAG: amidohydrolase [Gammaproteobacteria bacterium]|jgi:imidazolonepropionase-like amidohydrolase|tara:strand:- start:925 stop:2361 length:1437 start_codon:yes stop_codon:yes gene_type:complete